MVVAARKASAGPQSSCDSPSAWSNSRRKIANAAALVATAMKVVIGVGAPWYTSGVHWWKGATDALKASPVAASADARQEQRVGGVHLVARDCGGDPVEAHRPGGAVDQREAVQQRRRPDRAHHEVLEPGLERGAPVQVRGAQHVERDRQQLEADEQRHQAVRLGEHDHPGDRAEQERVVLAVAGLERRGRAQRQRDRHEPGDVEEHRHAERQRVDLERALAGSGPGRRAPRSRW